MNNVKVSVCCLTYNHIDYIEDALKGFLMQKTDFEYEILIHDDASTDGTTEVLLDYYKRYPDKIRLYLEEENQYGKGKKYTPMLLSESKGKYAAFCEGDDFWIYDGKLQAQYDLLENHPEIVLCYHNAIIYTQNEDKIRLNVVDHPSGCVSDEDIICCTKGWYPTASLFGYTQFLIEQDRLNAPTSDEGYRNYMSCKGQVYYMNRAWSIYRDFSSGGWNARYYRDKVMAAEHFKKTILYFREFNEYSIGRFEKYIKKRLFLGVDKYRDAHYGKMTECSVVEFMRCIDDLKSRMGHIADDVLDAYYSCYVIRCRDYYRFAAEEQLNPDDEVYLYGAGAEAIKALIELGKRRIIPKGFIVSDKQGFPAELIGIPVYEATEFKFDGNKKIWPCLIDGREAVLDILYGKGCSQIVI